MPVMTYQLPLGIANASSVLVVVSLFLACTRNDFVLVGPSPRIVFAGYVIDTWERWWYVMAFSVLSQISISINMNTLEPYITNVVQDHKTQRLSNPLHGHLVVQLKTSYDWILGILNTNLWVTLQVQFLLAGLLTDLVMSAVMTQRFLDAKKKDVLLPSPG